MKGQLMIVMVMIVMMVTSRTPGLSLLLPFFSRYSYRHNDSFQGRLGLRRGPGLLAPSRLLEYQAGWCSGWVKGARFPEC